MSTPHWLNFEINYRSYRIDVLHNDAGWDVRVMRSIGIGPVVFTDEGHPTRYIALEAGVEWVDKCLEKKMRR
jgi:hypothetical protein